MTSIELYSKGAKVWIPHPKLVWQSAELLEDYYPNKTSLTLLTESNETKEVVLKTENDLPPLRNPPILVGENDLTTLSYLHEPAVLHNLQVRFCQNKYIYTYCGIVLVAINPYDELPIYGIDTIQTYRGQSMGDLEPHIFAVAEEAYTKLEREQRDQSIIVSGESGAGKTVSAKYVMRYLAAVGGSSTETQIEKKVLASSPIMEAIGNAKTIRNDNSSRFGKFIELQFNKQFNISGASMRTYLLEKSRVVFQAEGERNYHIFYQLCASRKQLPNLYLDHQDKFFYLNQGSSPTIAGVNDSETFDETLKAFNLLGFTSEEIQNTCRVLSAILHIGNVHFQEAIVSTSTQHGQEGCQVVDNDKSMEILSELLDIDMSEMSKWLCTRKLVSMRDVILKSMTVEEAIMSRDALAKHIYAQLFHWIVLIINKTLETNAPRHKFIGVLDIYGFETFETNSFEQFCINYANEKLQQQFNLHVFKLEQEEYIKEGIEWKMIDFYDNQPCIDLIETKLGILDLLDEECRMPRGSDSSWTEKLFAKCMKYSHFGKARFGTSAFTINHFADKVQYESNGFLEKNRDTIIEEQINVIRQSKNKLVKKLFCSDAQKLAPPGTKLKIVSLQPATTSQKSHKKSVGSQFRDSLNLLMSTLNLTTPYYVRCIKPNDNKEPFEYNPARAVQQLRACGVLETIRLSAAGFPSRWTYMDFFYRYRVLCQFKDINRNNMQNTCENILRMYIKNMDMYQFGKTKIFFRPAQVAYLEKLRTDKLRCCCTIIQKTVRAFIERKRYLAIRKSVQLLQRYGRGYLARQLAISLRRERATIIIQKRVRGWLQKSRYQRLKKIILGIQTYCRGYLARLNFTQLRYNAKAVIIQKHYRGWQARKRVEKMSKHIVICQAAIRRFLARRLYRKLKIEARSIEHVKSLNKGLENKIISLQQKIDELQKYKNELKAVQTEVSELKHKLVLFKGLESDVKNLNTLIMEKNKTINKLEESLKAEREEKMDLISESEMQREHWDQETAKLRAELDTINEIVKLDHKRAEETLKNRLEEEKVMMQNDQDSDREAYQKLLEDYRNLEIHCEDLESQVNSYNNQRGYHKRNTSDLSISGGSDLTVGKEALEDYGYGSVRSTASSSSHTRERLEDIEWKEEGQTSSNEVAQTEPESKFDVALVIKLQHKLSEVEREKMRLEKRLNELDSSPRVERAEDSARDAIKISELELINSKLKSQLMELQASVNDGTQKSTLLEQFQSNQEELDRRVEEVIQLKGVLANQANNMKSIVNSKTRTGEYINEDGELALAYETQKTINKQLELELQDEKAKYKTYEREYKLEIEKLQMDNERQQRILAAHLTDKPQSQNEAYMQLEITRVTAENLELQDKVDSFSDQIMRLKKRDKILMKKLKEAGIDVDDVVEIEPTPRKMSVGNISKRPISYSTKRKSKDYMGMFSYPSGQEQNIMKLLIIDLKPRTAVTLLPGLPAYIVFMCIRHTDYINDETKVSLLLSSFTKAVKKVIIKRHEDFETSALWLCNTLRLLHNMKQYSGNREFQSKNTPKQNEQCLRNFDLSAYRQILSDIAVWNFQGLIRTFVEKIQPLIIPAILEHEEISGLSSSKRGTRASISGPSNLNTPTSPSHKPTTALIQELNNHYKMLNFYGVDMEVISQVFKQIYYFICATSLNNLLLRKDLCNWSKGPQIRHNLSHLEMWTREKNLEEASIQSTLQPIIQASQLLQARKTDKDVNSICEMCSALTPLRICKILNMYTPIDEFEQKVPVSFIRTVQEKLQYRTPTQEQQSLLMDLNYKYAVRFPFNPSDIRLEEIDLPEILKLSSILEKV